MQHQRCAPFCHKRCGTTAHEPFDAHLASLRGVCLARAHIASHVAHDEKQAELRGEERVNGLARIVHALSGEAPGRLGLEPWTGGHCPPFGQSQGTALFKRKIPQRQTGDER